MQQPTLRNVRIRSTRDAIAVFYGVARNVLPLITRRLDAEERLCITAGTVFVWEENANSEASGLGMVRNFFFPLKAPDIICYNRSDGMLNTFDFFACAHCVQDGRDGVGSEPGSRCKSNLAFDNVCKRLPLEQEFLFYHQKESDVGEETINPVTPWAQMMRKRSNRFPPAFSLNSKKALESQRLIKQTFSVLVSLPRDRPTGTIRKWHLSKRTSAAYFNQETLNELDTIEDLRLLDSPVPEGWFRSARATKTRRENRPTVITPGDATLGMGIQSPTSEHGQTMPFSTTPTALGQARYRGFGIGQPQSIATPKAAAFIAPATVAYRSTPSPRHPGFTHSPLTPTGQLVPLEYLQNSSQKNRRNPTDEQLLRRFGV
ncbi:hypothetical protein MKEN_00609900 [Mycena kentingensis (nom. inval.)]|nr:hypothetical protein MKEN_00609900 [Mycena kentingensis (nom. inval.)]